MFATTVFGPLYGSLAGFGTAGLVCLLAPVGLIGLLWWLVFSDYMAGRRARRHPRLAHLPSLPPAPPGGRTLEGWVAVIHAQLAAWLPPDRLTTDPGVVRDLHAVVTGVVEAELPRNVARSQREAVVKAVVSRLLARPADTGTQPASPETPENPQGRSE